VSDDVSDDVSGTVRVSVIIPAYDAADTLDTTLDAIARQVHTDDVEVIVADNGSTDATRATAEAWCDRMPLRVVDASARRGQAAAMNLAAEDARGGLLVFTDADDVPLTGWLDAWLALDDSVAHASGPVVWFAYDDSPPTAPVDAPRDAPVHMGFKPYALGTQFAVRRAWFDRAGGFDEGVPPAQDIDLSWRLQLAGAELVFVTDAVLAKRERGGVRSIVQQYYRYGLCDPLLSRRFRADGVPPTSAGAVLKSYAGLVLRLPLLGDAVQRVRWARQVGRRWGRLVGSFRHRCLYL
jgi:glycosyltransferase involved in cell wall biosynthesis